MFLKTDKTPSTERLSHLLSIVTDAGVIVANNLAMSIVGIEEKDGHTIVDWKSEAPDEFREAIETAWSSRTTSGGIMHNENPS